MSKASSKHILLFFIGLFAFTWTLAQDTTAYDPTRSYSKEALQEDFTVLREALEGNHPGLYTYQTEEAFQALFDSLKSQVNAPLTEIEFFRMLAPAIADIRCGHTQLNLSKHYYNTQQFFPLGLSFFDEAAHVFGNYSFDSTIVQATQVTHINAQPIAEIKAAIEPYICVDGFIPSAANYQLNQSFPFLLAEALDHPDTFHIEGKYIQNNRPVTLDLPAVSKKRINAIAFPDWSPTNLPLRYGPIAKQTVMLTIKSFYARHAAKAGQHYRKFIKRSFKDIRRTNPRNLIIDLRGNLGGTETEIQELLRYLAESPFQSFDSVYLNANPIQLNQQHTTFSLDHFRKEFPTDSVAPKKFLLRNYAGTTPVKPKRRAYRGKVIILVDGGTASAASIFAVIAREQKRAIFVGEETASTFDQLNGLAIPVITLPNTKLRLRVPLMKGILAISDNPNPGRGLIPDYIVRPTVIDFLQGRDPALEYALQVAKRAHRR